MHLYYSTVQLNHGKWRTHFLCYQLKLTFYYSRSTLASQNFQEVYGTTENTNDRNLTIKQGQKLTWWSGGDDYN